MYEVTLKFLAEAGKGMNMQITAADQNALKVEMVAAAVAIQGARAALDYLREQMKAGMPLPEPAALMKSLEEEAIRRMNPGN